MTNESTPTIFIAYSHKDKEHLEELRTFISPLIRSKKVNVWFDGEIRAGAVWDVEIKKALHSADIILLLVSPNSLNSDYFYEKEVADALNRHNQNQARVIPIILNPCLWDDTPLHQIQVLPKGAKPISEWQNKNSAWDDVARGIKNTVEEINDLKVLAEKKAIEAQLTKEREEKEAQIKAQHEKIRLEKEKKIKDFSNFISSAIEFEKIQNWQEAENAYRSALMLWEKPLKPEKEKILNKVTFCIEKQNTPSKIEYQHPIEPSSITSSRNNGDNTKSNFEKFTSFFVNKNKVAWILFGISIIMILIKDEAYNAEHKEKQEVLMQVSQYANKFPILIDDIKVASTKKGGDLNFQPDYELPADSVEWLTPVIKYRAFTYCHPKFQIKIIQPNGEIRRGDTSPGGASYEVDFAVSPALYAEEKRLKGWGNEYRSYSKGYYKIEIWYKNNCIGSNSIVLK